MKIILPASPYEWFLTIGLIALSAGVIILSLMASKA